ncbi:response regulator transcription factor [Gemmiger formicilis]|uniref:winged helix-turn-helix domain-containing protein n=1 Tax=Gemmiger formicilis TaxID=745368 RepID=UPI001DEB3940|nr:response regulator transcription factor [Gemmiger formicilis]
MADRSTIQEQYAVQEMKQRVHHVLRRANRNHTEFRFKDLYMDLRAHRVWRAGQEVELTPREYALLETLVLNRNIALTRGQLLADAWGYDYIGESRTVDVHINRVRRKLGLQHEIQTVFKVGYRLNTRGTL